MRTITATILATTLFVSSALAAPQSSAPISAGKPAGAKEAALLGPNTFLVLVGVGVIAGSIAMAVSNNNGDRVTGPTTTSTTRSGLP